MANPLIIKGAIYKSGDTLLQPHFTGQFFMVDCTEFKTKKEIKENYGKLEAKEMLSNSYLMDRGVKYYECQSSPWNCTADFELLSDLSDLQFINDECEFN
jgi:hypothetical protein